MRILIVTHDHPLTGLSGVASYCLDLEAELVRRGYEVVHLFSAERDWRMRPHLRWSSQGGVTYASLVNSPLPPPLSAQRPQRDCVHPEIDRLFAACLARAAPDIVHIHSFLGFSGSMLSQARRLDMPVMLSLHDFWAFCARFFLIRTNGDACSGPDGGANCARFCSDHGPLGRRTYGRLTALLPPGRALRMVERIREVYVRALPGDHAVWVHPEVRAPRDGTGKRADIRAHGGRAAFLLDLFREADSILAVSQFVKESYVRQGMPSDRIQVLPLGLSFPRRIEPRLRHAHTPLRVGFLGKTVPLKGPHILARAARGIPPAQARFLFFGPASRDSITYLQGLAGDAQLEFRGPYSRQDLPDILAELDVVVVPTLAQETVGLTVIEAQAAGLPVVASRIGAIPEYVRDGENGLLFEAGNADALRAALRRFIETPALVATMSVRTVPPMAIGHHVDVLTAIYHQACAGRRERERYGAAAP